MLNIKNKETEGELFKIDDENTESTTQIQNTQKIPTRKNQDSIQLTQTLIVLSRS